MQSWPVMESQSQQCPTTSQDFFIMLIYTKACWYIGLQAAVCLHIHEQHTPVTVPRLWWADGLFGGRSHRLDKLWGGLPRAVRESTWSANRCFSILVEHPMYLDYMVSPG